MGMKRFINYVETTDGTVHGPHRITFRHRQQVEKTCKARGEDPNGSFAEHVLAWAASTRPANDEHTVGPLNGLSLDDWEAQVLDYTNQQAEADELDPTNREASAAS